MAVVSEKEMTMAEALEIVYDHEFPVFAEDNLKIQTMEGHLVHFEINEVQEVLEAILRDIRVQGRLVRLVILKARREGVSTYFTGRFYWKTTRNFNRYSMLITHEPEATDFLFGMCKRYQAHNEFKPQEKYNNKKMLEFNNAQGTGLDSAIRVATAGKEDIGSGQLIHHLHLSELSKWPKGVTTPLLTSVLQCVPMEPDTEIVFESTGKGIGGEFYDRYLGARYQYEIFMDGEKPSFKVTVNEKAVADNEYSSIFIPWFVFKKYQMAIPPDFTRTKDEEELVKIYGLSDEQLQWRRWCIANNCNGDVSIFQQEYPSNPMEAFVSSGRPVFDTNKLLALQKVTTRPKVAYECQLSSGQWMAQPDGRLKVWQEPIAGRSYIISADVAEGLEKGDYSVADVVDQLTGAQVAQWHGHIDPDQFALILLHLGRRYNTAWIVPERNNHGLMVVTRLIDDYRYPMVWGEKVIEPPHKPRMRYGWVTNKKTKPAVIDNLVAEVRDGMHGIVCVETFGEMISFKHKDDGSMEAEEGMLDDRVMSIAIAKYVRKSLPLPSIKPAHSEKTFTDGSMSPVKIAPPPLSIQAWT